MRRHAPIVILLLALAVLAGGLAVLFQRRIAQGDVFPPYSSLRADPLGTRALHDALAGLPALRVERRFKPLADLEPAPARTILLAGVPPANWGEVTRAEFDALDAAIRGGSRVIIVLRATAARDPAEEKAEREAKEKARKEKQKEKRDEPPPALQHVDLKRRWGADVKERPFLGGGDGAVRTTDERAADLPATIAWRSEVFFELAADPEWRVLYRRGARPVLVERRLGLGSLVLAADSYFLSNEALQKDRAPTLLAWLVGPHARIVFDEMHLGVAARPGVAALARRYGLSSAFFTLLLLAALFVWRQMARFVPSAEEAADVALTYHPAAGLEALLRRSVAPADLAGVCAAEWKPTARASDQAHVAEALAAAPKNASPVARYNAAVRALRRC